MRRESGGTVIVNLPGSVKAVSESLDALIPGILHASKMLEVTDISNEISLVFIAPLFFGISFIYSSVGFGGAAAISQFLCFLN